MNRLFDWRTDNKLTRAKLGEMLDVTAVAVGRYEQGRVPDPKVLQRIIEITDGAVTANDFFDLPDSSPSQTGQAA